MGLVLTGGMICFFRPDIAILFDSAIAFYFGLPRKLELLVGLLVARRPST